ncbi:MAG TPA: cyclic nucleotide-binding domain-containing protein [Candidatus Obscuribacterales bacterium]
MLEFFGNLTFALIALSYLVRDIFVLRLLSIVASLAGIIYNFFVAPQPLWLVINWNLAFIGVNLVQIGRIVYDRRKIAFSAEQQELYETVFTRFSPIEFLKLMRLSHWASAPAGEYLAQAGQELDRIMLIYSGEASVESGGREVNRLRDGDFIGEMSFLSAQAATASVRVSSATRYLFWRKDDLQKLLERNPNLRFALQTVLGQDLSRKLIRQDGP